MHWDQTVCVMAAVLMAGSWAANDEDPIDADTALNVAIEIINKHDARLESQRETPEGGDHP